MDPERPTPELLIWAYQRGVFPMAHPETGAIDWFSPDPRTVLPLDAVHVPRRLARQRRGTPLAFSTDTAFETVMRECAAPRPGREHTWIDERLIEAYVGLHRMGLAHSVEAWRDGVLVGGIYGVQLGGALFGESMFTAYERGGRDASKLCLLRLVELLRARGFALLDTQFQNPHIAQFGCVEIPRARYLKQLHGAMRLRPEWPKPGPLP